jgi:hypothetical protein
MSKVHGFICCLCLAGLPLIGSPAISRVEDGPAGQTGTVQEQIFADVRKGIVEASADLFSRHFGPQVFIQLPETEGAHYSAKQAFYVLDLFLHAHKTLGITLTPYGMSESNPYASGQATFVVRGVRQDARVYVALALRGDRWVISHLSIR